MYLTNDKFLLETAASNACRYKENVTEQGTQRVIITT